MSANAAWNVVDADFPAGGSPRQKLGHALKYATLAAAMDVWQPWEFRLDDGYIELFASADRAAEAVDPDGRALMIRCGAALFHLKVALKRFGCLGRVEFFPDFDQAGLVARIHCGFSQDRDLQIAALFEAMTRNRKNFAPAGEAPVSEAVLESLRGTVAGEKAWLEFSQSESSRLRLLALAESGARSAMTGHPLENQFAVHVASEGAGPNETARGALKPSRIAQWTRPFLNFTVQTSGAGRIAVKADGKPADQMAALAVLKTKTDDKHGWLAVGRALAQVRLQAQVLDVSCRVFDHAFGNRHVREELRTTIGRKGFAQVVVGFGSRTAQWMFTPSTQQPVTATMR